MKKFLIIGAICVAFAGLAVSSCNPDEPQEIAVSSVSFDQKELALTEGQTATLKATVSPDDAADKTLAWSSDKPSIATVDQQGKVTAVKAGSAKITAESVNGNTATCKVTVTAAAIPVTGIAWAQKADVVTVGESAAFKVSVTPENATDKTVEWQSSKPSVATVTGYGLSASVKGVKAGQTMITATCGGKSVTREVLVKDPDVPVSSLDWYDGKTNMTEGDEYTFRVQINPSNATDQTVYWRSLAPSVLSVTPSGSNSAVVKALSAGKTSVEASCGGKTIYYEVTVRPAVSSITWVQTQSTLMIGEKITFEVKVLPYEALQYENPVWELTESGIVSLQRLGSIVTNVTALRSGTTVLKVSCGGKTVMQTITVKANYSVLYEQTGAKVGTTLTVTLGSGSLPAQFSFNVRNEVTGERVNPMNAKILATSDNLSVASFMGLDSEKFALSVKKRGTAHITVYENQNNKIHEFDFVVQ